MPGLLSVIRSGRVAVANPLGSGVIENPVFLKYLPQISRRLLGRDLRLNSVKTYWAGDSEDLKFIKHNIQNLVVKPVFRSAGESSQIGAELSKNARAELLKKINMFPLRYVAQDYIVPADIPTIINNEIRLRPTILRSFAVANDKSYNIMPGGLTRVGLNKGSAVISNQVGSTSKDTWVVASEPQLVKPSPFVDNKGQFRFAQQASLPSRVVENLFWMGRYAERAESALRLLRTVFVVVNGVERTPEVCCNKLLVALTEITDTLPGFKGAADELFDEPDEELLAVVLDPARPGSVKSCLNSMLASAEESKELLSSDTLRVINDIRDANEGLDQALGLGLVAAPEEALDPLVTALMALAGLAQESMIRGVGWRFMEIGRRIERALQFTTLTRSLLIEELPDEEEESLLQAVFLTLEVLITYRRRYRGRIEMAQALELMMIDCSNPRSLIYQLQQLQNHINELPHLGVDSRELQSEQRAALEAITTLRLKRLVDLTSADDESGKRAELDQMLSRLAHLVSDIALEISDKYFDHRVGPQQLVRAVWEGE